MAAANTQEPERRIGHESAHLGNSLYFFGGCDVIRNVMHIWHIQSKTWTKQTASGAKLAEPCIGASCIAFNGLIYTFGGMCGHFSPSDTVYSLDPSEMKWYKVDTSGGADPKARIGGTIAIVGSRLMMFGGEEEDASVYELKLEGTQKAAWVEIEASGPGPEPRMSAQMAEIDENRALIHGGVVEETFTDEFFVIDFAKKEWTTVKFDPTPSGRVAHSLCRIYTKEFEGKTCFLLAGGKGNKFTDHAYILDFDKKKAYKMENVEAINNHTSHFVADENGAGEVYFLGGVFTSNDQPREVLTCLCLGPKNTEYMRIAQEINSSGSA